MSATTGDQRDPISRIGRALVRVLWGTRRDPGFHRLGMGGAFLAWEGLVFALSVVSHPDRVWITTNAPSTVDVLRAPALPTPIALGVLLPIAILGFVGGGRLWLGGSPRLALIASFLGVVFACGVGLALGAVDVVLSQTLLFALILGGSWARRRPGTRLTDLLRAGAIRPINADG